jgi:hypothetical protein
MSDVGSSRQLQATGSSGSVDALLAAEEPVVQLTAGYGESTLSAFNVLRNDFENFFLDMSEQAGGLDSFHPQHRAHRDVFRPGSPSLSYNSAAMFLKHWASGSCARLQRPIHVRSALRKVDVLAHYTRHTTGTSFDSGTRAQLKTYCEGDLQSDLGLGTGPVVSAFLQSDVLDTLFRALFAPDLGLRTIRSRWQMGYWISMTVSSEARVGTCMRGKPSYLKQKRLVWGDITLVIEKSKVIGSRNSISHGFVSPNDKTGKPWRVELEDFPVLWLDATFYLLVIAHIAGAFPPGWTYEDLIDPKQFDHRNEDAFELTFDPTKSSEAVFLTDDEGEVSEWTTGTVNTHLGRLAQHSGVEGKVTAHSLRRSGAVALKLKSASFCDPRECEC